MKVVLAPGQLQGVDLRSRCGRSVRRRVAHGDARSAEIVARPMADGGEGTLDAFAAAVPGSIRMPVTVTGPHGRPVAASWLLLPADRRRPGRHRGRRARVHVRHRTARRRPAPARRALRSGSARRSPRRSTTACHGSCSASAAARPRTAAPACSPRSARDSRMPRAADSARRPRPRRVQWRPTSRTPRAARRRRGRAHRRDESTARAPPARRRCSGRRRASSQAAVERADAGLARLAALLPADPDDPWSGRRRWRGLRPARLGCPARPRRRRGRRTRRICAQRWPRHPSSSPARVVRRAVLRGQGADARRRARRARPACRSRSSRDASRRRPTPRDSRHPCRSPTSPAAETAAMGAPARWLREAGAALARASRS